MISDTIKAYIDLTRVHFAFVWPLLFCSGLALAYHNYGGFSWQVTLTAALIGLFGFIAGLVLNDYVDRNLDRFETSPNLLTNYWRLFGTRPLPENRIPASHALSLFLVLVVFTTLLITVLPYPNSVYVFLIMLWCYGVEVFYQIKKRDQTFPVAQIIGRTDFTLFPVAGYLCIGQPDMTAILFILFFYPFTLAHLGVNDLADTESDHLRGMKTISVLYGTRGCTLWIVVFTLLHLAAAVFVMSVIPAALPGFVLGALLLCAALILLGRSGDGAAAMKALPLFHGALLVYAVSIILGTLL